MGVVLYKCVEQCEFPIGRLIEVNVELQHRDEYVQYDIEKTALGTHVSDILLGLVVPDKVQLLFHCEQDFVFPKNSYESVEKQPHLFCLINRPGLDLNLIHGILTTSKSANRSTQKRSNMRPK